MVHNDEIDQSQLKQNYPLSVVIAQSSVDVETQTYSQVETLGKMMNQLQEQQKNVLAVTDKISSYGERFSQNLELVSKVILEQKHALDSISEVIASVVGESLRVTNEVAQTSVVLKEESEVTKEQHQEYDEPLDDGIDNSSVMQVLTSLREIIDRCKKDQVDDAAIILNAQRVLDVSKSPRHKSTSVDMPSAPIVGS